MSEWYISRGEGQEGPMTAKLIAALLARGEFRANDTLAWKEGMADWKTIAESGVLTEASLGRDVPAKGGPPIPTAIKNPAAAPIKGDRSSLPQPTASNPAQKPVSSSASDANPYAAPVAKVSTIEKISDDYPGVSRRVYLLTLVLSTALIVGVLYAMTGFDPFAMLSFSSGQNWLFFLLRASTSIVVMVVTYKRLKNLGMRGWWLFGTVLPLLNIWVFWRLSSCPTGYADHKTLDTPGKVASSLFALVILLSLSSVLITELT